MMDLSRVSLSALESLLALAQRDDGDWPGRLSGVSLPGEVLAAAAPLTALDREAAVLLLTAVLAERRGHRGAKLDLVWTGPEAKVAHARDTAVVVAEMFGSARRSVLIGGAYFDHGKEIFEPLHRVMRDRGVQADAFLNLEPLDEEPDPARAARVRTDEFLRRNWPFGDPTPTLYYYPDGISQKKRASIHAKCIVIDGKRSLVTSANFTDRGQTRNIEVGVVIDDANFAEALTKQWWGAVGAGVLRKVELQ